MGKLIDSDKLKAHYAWWKDGKYQMTLDEAKTMFDTIIDLQPTVIDEPSGMVTFREGDKLLHIDKDYLVCLWRMAQSGELTEPKHGRWITDDGIILVCSRCGRPLEEDGYSIMYCPACGAKMDLEKGEDNA